MNNEIGRKITSLTLMTIMLAGGMVVAAPSMVPTAAAAGQLYVSAENAQFDNLIAGPMVVEVIVKDPNRSRTDLTSGEPTIMIDNNQLRMAQGNDGNWYGYFADNASIDLLVADTSDQLDFGLDTPLLGANGNGIAVFGEDTFTNGTNKDTNDFAGVIDNPPRLSNWNSSGLAAAAVCDQCGQIGLRAGEWPILQTFDLSQGDFDIVHEAAGNDEIVTLDHNNADLDDYASLTLDRNSATQGSVVHLFIVDQQLNIDPTDEDKVIFRVDQAGVSTDSGVSWTNGTLNAGLVSGAYETAWSVAGSGHGFGDNGVLLINNNTSGATTHVVEKVSTSADDTITAGGGTTGYTFLVFVEDGDNTGTFSNVDDLDQSNLEVSSTAKRGTTATFDYNDSAQSFIVSNDFGIIDMDESSVGDEWNSGENLVVTLVDQDLNKNTLSDEDMTIATHNSTVPSLQIGSPISLDSTSQIGVSNMTIGTFNKIGTLTNNMLDTGDTDITVNFTKSTIADFRTVMNGTDFVFVNYNVTSIINVVTGLDLVAADSSANNSIRLYGTAETATTLEAGLVQLTAGSITAKSSTLDETGSVRLNFTQTGGSVALAGETLYVDIFTFGDKVGKDRQNNAIYRLLLEESGDDTATFVGDVEFIMLNQINEDKAATFSGLTTISDEIDIIVHEDLTDEDSPRINYLDLGADGVETQIGDQVEAPSHSGVVTFDSANYKIADTVVVTLDDQDLNTDSELIDVYITSTDDNVGDGAGQHVVDITFNDVKWQSGNDAKSDSTYAGSPNDGLESTGFTLVETTQDSGLFTGSFQVPSTYYDSARSTTTDKTHTTTGTDIEVNYFDFRDASGETIEVGAGASINANTGSVEFDRTVYPVPFGNETAGERFALHASASNLNGGTTENALAQGDVVVHIRITDADYDVSAFGEDSISDGTGSSDNSRLTDKVVLKIERGSNSVEVAQIGNSTFPITRNIPNIWCV